MPGDDIMTSIIHQQTQFLKNSKQRIIHNLNGIDEIIEISLYDEMEMDMEANGIASQVLCNHGGTYRLLFDGTSVEEADKILETISTHLSTI
jgi:hypothetical protein